MSALHDNGILPNDEARCSGEYCIKKVECKRFLASTISSNSKAKLIDPLNCIEPIYQDEKIIKKAYSKRISV